MFRAIAPWIRKRNRWALPVRLERLEARVLLAVQPNYVPFDQVSLDIDPDSYDEASILVRFRDEHRAAVASYPSLGDGIVSGASIGSRVGDVPGLHQVNLYGSVGIETALAAYQDNPMVLYAEPNYRVRIAETIPNDSRFNEMWPLHNTGQTGGQTDADIDAPLAWDVSQGSGSTVVAVIDTGVDYLHPDLASNIWVNPGEIAGDGIDNDNNGYIDDVNGFDFINGDADPMDDQGHGTHVAGTIGAVGNNGFGVAGINWNVQIMALKFLGADGSGTSADAIEAIEYAVDNGAAISNNSWGGDPFSQAMHDAIVYARDGGHIFIAAAGNGDLFGIGQDNDAAPFYPASYDVDNIIAVAATDHNDHVGGFSNYGATDVDVAAPGVNILSTTRNGNYGLNTGTSMAAPHVAGVTALVQDLNPQWDYADVIQQVLTSAEPLPQLYGVVSTGGRINVANAVGNPEPPLPPPTPGALPVFEGFADVPEFLRPQVGAWNTDSGQYHATPMVQNQNLFAVSTVDLSAPLPANVELQATINAEEGFLGFFGIILSDHLTNGYLAFDYHGPDDFKFAGADMKNDRWLIGHRDSNGWQIDSVFNQTLDADTDYRLRLLIENNNAVTLYADGVEKTTHQFGSSVTDGDVGLAMRDSTTHFDHFLVKEYVAPTTGSFPLSEDFDDGVADNFQEQSGSWFTVNDRYRVVPHSGEDAVSTILLGQSLPNEIEVQATLQGESVSGYYHNALVVFDYQSNTDFKFAGAYVGADRWVIGRRTSSGWIEDAEVTDTIDSGADYDLQLAISNNQVELLVGGVTKVSHAFGDNATDGAVGLGSQNAVAEFDNVAIQTYVPPPPPPAGSLPLLENFDDGVADNFDALAGAWTVTANRYRVVPSLGNDAVSTLQISQALPSDLEIQATLNGESVSGYYHNALIIFDYQNSTDFKFAGAYVGGNRWVIGRRTAGGWVEDAEISETINTAADYDVQVVINGADARLFVDDVLKVSHSFGNLLNDGDVGLGTQNGVAQYDDVVVQAYAPPHAGSLPIAEDFNDGVADFFDVNAGDWSVTSNRYRVVPATGSDAVSTMLIGPTLPTSLEFLATINGESVSGYYHNALVVFDYQNNTDFKFAGAYVGGNRWVVGRRTPSGWVEDAEISETINTAADYDLQIILTGNDVELVVDGIPKVSHTFADPLTDGTVGLATQNAVAQFDDVLVQEYVPPPVASLPFAEDFNDGQAQFFDINAGAWTVTADRYRVVPNAGSDAVSTIRIDEPLPADLRMLATINGESVSGYYHNALLVFDYQSDTDFKFAGAYVGGNRWVIGRRTPTGWVEDAEMSETINTAADYDVQVVIHGSDVELLVAGVSKVTHSFGDPLNDGMLGLGTQNAVAQYDDVVVQAYSPPGLPYVEDFEDGIADFFDVQSGVWTPQDGGYRVVPDLGSDAISTIGLGESIPSAFEFQATLNGESVSGYYHNALLVFDYQNETDFKFAGAYVGGNRWVVGRRTASGWTVDAEISETINTAADYDIQLVANGADLEMLVDGVSKVSHTFGDSVNDGTVGFATQNAVANFDDVLVQSLGISIAWLPPGQPDLGAANSSDDDPAATDEVLGDEVALIIPRAAFEQIRLDPVEELKISRFEAKRLRAKMVDDVFQDDEIGTGVAVDRFAS